MIPITQGSLLLSSPILNQLARGLIIVFVVILSFQFMRQLFGTTEIEGTANTITSRHKLLGVPLTRSMGKSEFKLVELKYYRGRRNRDTNVGEEFSGSWVVRIVGTSGLLKFYKTQSLEEANWLGRFVAEWYGLKVERKGDDRKFGF